MLMETGVPALIVGGCAVQLYGYGRFTKDFDCVIAVESQPRMKAALQQAGFDEIAANHLVARYRHREQPGWVLDTLFVKTDTFEKMWAMRREIASADGLLTVASPMTLVAMKLHALKQSASRMNDLLDVIETLKRQPASWTIEDLKSVCDKQGPPGIFDTIKPHVT